MNEKKSKSKELWKKVLLSFLIITVGVLSYASVIDMLFQKTFPGNPDEIGSRYFRETAKRTIYTFAIVRGINGIISAAQGTNIAVSPAGVGVQLSVGEVLDPINDLIERFSWVMMISAISLGIQKTLLDIGAWLGFGFLLSFAMVLMLAGVWLSRFSKVNLIRMGWKFVLISLVIRFCIPVAAIASENVYELFLKEKYTRSLESLEKANAEIKDSAITDEDGGNPDPESGYLESLRQIKNIMGIKGKISFLKERISDYANHLLDLIIVFVVQTVVIPLLVLFGLARFGTYVFNA